MSKPEILGGETPFVAASDMPFACGPGVVPLPAMRFYVDGVDQTRSVTCAMLASIQRGGRDVYADNADGLREFMQGAIAGANTDLRALGISPLISFAEVDEWERQLAERGTFDRTDGGGQ